MVAQADPGRGQEEWCVRVAARELANDEGNRLLRIARRCSGSVVTWRRAQMVLLSAQGMDIAQIARVAFTSPDRVDGGLAWHGDRIYAIIEQLSEPDNVTLRIRDLGQ
jgi:hypothetical protein